MTRQLVIDATGLVVNVVVMNGNGDWSPPDGCTAEPEQPGVGTGWTKRQDGSFLPPPDPPEAG